MVIWSPKTYEPWEWAEVFGALRPFGIFIILIVVGMPRFSIATGCAAAITEVLVKARAMKEIRENFIFGTLWGSEEHFYT
jgi:hypothetical protein